MYILKKYYRKLLLIIIPLVILVFCFVNINESNENDLEIENEAFKTQDNIVEVEETKKINIKGAVKNPGVYSFEDGERVIDAINKSGGLLENADTSVINLSKNLFDEMVIVIYTSDEVNDMKQNNILIQYVEKECECPKLTNDACLESENINHKDNNLNNISNSFNKISINTATSEQLQTLPGIGTSKAEAIINYRTEFGNFTNIEDIKNVSGIGDSLFEKIKDNITI